LGLGPGRANIRAIIHPQFWTRLPDSDSVRNGAAQGDGQTRDMLSTFQNAPNGHQDLVSVLEATAPFWRVGERRLTERLTVFAPETAFVCAHSVTVSGRPLTRKGNSGITQIGLG
jgi:hypothetical protein